MKTTNTTLFKDLGEDPLGKQSKHMRRSSFNKTIAGDGDIWVERLFESQTSGRRKTFFCSERTGKCFQEPPTGASKVIYLQQRKR